MMLWAAATAEAATRQSFESCSLITSEYLTVLQLASRGFDRDTLTATLPSISDKAQSRVDALLELVDKEGLDATYSRINTEYAACARKVYEENGLPPQGSREDHFHFCAGENKVRYEVLMAAMVGARPDQVLPQLAGQHRNAARAVFDTHRQGGPLSVFDHLATELKHCVNIR